MELVFSRRPNSAEFTYRNNLKASDTSPRIRALYAVKVQFGAMRFAEQAQACSL